MAYHLLANLVMLLHFGFILFAVLGGLLVMRWPRLAWLHLPAVAWAAGIEFYGGICPLTPLENWLRARSGAAGFESGFIEHYLGALIYPEHLTPGMQIILGLSVVAINLAIYGWILWRQRSST